MAQQKGSSVSSTLPPELIAADERHRAKAGLAPKRPPHRRHDNEQVHAARAPPPLERLLDKHEVLACTGVSFPTLWAWMRAGRFPRSRIVGGKSMWLASEITAWLAALPVRPLKGDEASGTPPAGKQRLET
jgi:predicted DNA-binding transcriptional regulator AlpA